jgi:hypothetical protein
LHKEEEGEDEENKNMHRKQMETKSDGAKKEDKMDAHK